MCYLKVNALSEWIIGIYLHEFTNNEYLSVYFLWLRLFFMEDLPENHVFTWRVLPP